MAGGPTEKGSKKQSRSQSQVTAQPSPAHACAQAATGPCPDLPVLSLPSRLPCLLSSILRQPSLLPFPLCSDRKGLGIKTQTKRTLARDRARSKTAFIQFSLTGVCETTGNQTISPPSLPLRNQRGGPAFGAPAGK